MEISGAASLLPVLEEALLNDLEVGEGLGERGPDIIAPVGGTVADHGATKLDGWQGLVEGGLEVVLINLPGEVGDVDSSIGLS
jgi:hypothetical protein